jgi:cobalt-zinc-cadmium efflux system membrane fusion protein
MTVPLLAPIDGTVVERNVNPGQVVDTSTLTPWQMFTITDSSRVWVEADVYERDLGRVKVGQPVRIQVASLPNRTFTGIVNYIVPGVSATSRTLKVRTEIRNPDGLLKPGMFAEVSVSSGQGPQVPVVPVSAVQVDGDTDYVYVESPDRKYRKRKVHLGPEDHGVYVVRDGVRSGERVVTHGGLFLAAEQSS